MEKLDLEAVDAGEISHSISVDSARVRDKKDTPIYSAAAISRPDYVISGDGTLRSDLKSQDIVAAGTSREFLREFAAQLSILD